MLARTRRLAAGSVAASALSMVALATSASAATPPPWGAETMPTTSATCTTPGPASDPTHLSVLTFTDTGQPTITSVSFAGSNIAVLGPGNTSVKVRALATETCSGVGEIRVGLVRGVSTFLPLVSMGFETTDAYHASVSQTVTLTTALAGLYHPNEALVFRRYDTFTVGLDFALTASTPGSASAYIAGPFSSTRLYMLLKTTITNAASKATVKKGKSVTFSTVLKKASGSTYVNAAGEAVVFQTRIGKGKWVSRATRTTGATGAASYAFAPTTTMSYRWVHANRLSSTYTAASVATAKVIKVT